MDLAGMKRRELQALCKRHGLSAGGSNADLVARLDAALSGAAGAEEEEVAGVEARKGCLKQTGGDVAEAKKVTFAAEERKARRLRSRVIWSPIVAKTRGKSTQAGTDSPADGSISAEVGADVPVRRSRRNSLSAVEAEELGEAVAVDRKRKRKNQQNDESVAVSAEVRVSSRVTRRSSLAVAAAVLPPAVEKKRGRGKAAVCSSKLAVEIQDCEPDVQNSAQVKVPARIIRSLSIAPVVMSPTVVDNKRKRKRKTGDAQTNVELPTVSDVPRNEAPVTRSLRNRVVQVNNSMVDEIHTARQLENKMQPSRPLTRRHQQISSSVEDKNQEQTAAPNKPSILRRSGRNHSEDVEKQPELKEPVRRSTRKSVVLATTEKEENDLTEEKNPEVRVRRSTVPVKDKNSDSEDAVKQTATKGPVRGSRSKSVVSELHEKEKGLIAEKNTVEGIQNAKGKDVEKQFVVKQPTRRSTRKSVLPDMLENNSGLLAAQMNVRRSTRKSILPNMINEENQNHSKMSRKETFDSGKCHEDERQQKVKEPIRRSRRSVAAVPLEEQSNGLHEEKMSKNPTRRSTRKSVALNEVEKVSLDHTEIVAKEPEKVGEEGLKLRKHRRSSLEISSSANDSWRKEQNTQMTNERDNTRETQLVSNSQTSKGRSSKRRRTTSLEEVMSVKEANDDIIIRDATKDAHKATHEYNKKSSNKVQEICQVNATREEFYSGPLLVTVALTDEICTAQSVPVVIPGSESDDNANGSSDKSKQPQEHYDTQDVDSHLSETRSGKLDQSPSIAGLVPHNCVVSEDKALMSEDDLSIDFTIGYCEEQSPVSGEGRVGLEANTGEPGEKNLANVMSTGLHAKSLQRDIAIIAEETDKDVLPMAFPIEEHGEKYAVSHVAVEKSVGWDASACESAGKPITGIFSNDLHTKRLQHDCGRLTKETGDDCSLPVPNADKGCSSDGRPSSFGLELMFAEACKESYSKNIENTAEEIVGGNKSSTPVTPGFYMGSVCLEDEDVQPTGCDADKNIDVDQGVAGEENTAVEITGGNKPNTPVAPGFYVESDCLEDGKEEVLAPEKCNDQHVPAKTNLKMNLNDELGPGMESSCSITEKNERFVADNLDKQLIIQVQQGDMQECDHEKPSICSETRESKLECGLPEDYTAVEIDGGNKPRAPLTPGFYVASDCLEDEDVQTPGCDADKKLDVDQCVAGEENIDVTPGFYVRSDCLEDEHVQCTRCDADKKLDVDQGVVEEEVLALEKSNDQHVPAKTDLNMKLNDEVASPCMESGCSITQKKARLVTDNLDQLAICDVEEGDPKKPSPCSTTPECKYKCGLPEETILPPKNMGSLSRAEQSPFGLESLFSQENIHESMNMGSLSSAEQSPFGLESLFSQENIHESMGSATAHTKNGFDGSNDCHVKSALENTRVSEPYSHDDIVDGTSKNDDCMQTCQQDNGMEGLPEANLDEERVLSVFSLDAKNIKEVINFEEVACEGEESKKVIHCEELKASSEKTNVNGPDAIENPSISLVTTGYKHEGALSEEAACAMKNYAGTCSSNPRELLMDLQSLFSKGNIKEDGLAFPSAESSEDESINIEQQVKVHHGSNLSHLRSTDLLDEVLHQGYSHEDRSNVDRVEQVASELSTNDIVKASAAAKCLQRGLVLFPSEERSNLNDGQLNRRLESPNSMGSGLNYDKCVSNNSANGSVVVVVGERTSSGSGLPQDYPKDHYPQQELLDGCSVESSLQGPVSTKKIVSVVAGIGSPSSSIATPDYTYDGALSKEAVCRLKNYTGTCSTDPKHLIMDLQSLHSEGSTEKPDLQDNLAFPSAQSGRDEPIVCHVEKLVDTHVSLEPHTHQGPCMKKIVSSVADIGSPSCIATPDYKYDGALSKEVVCRMKNYTGTCSVDPKHLIMELQSLHSEGSTEKPDLQDNLAFPSAESGRDEPIVCHVEKLVDTHVSLEPHTYQGPCQDLSRHEEKESCMSVPMRVKESEGFLRSSHMKGSITSVQIDLADDACLIERQSLYHRDIVAPVEVLCEEKADIKYVPTTDSDILQEKSYSNGHGICQSRSQKHIHEANSRLSSCGTKVLHQDHEKECNKHNEEIPYEQLNTKMSDESEELSFSCDKEPIENFCSGPAKGDLYSLPKDFHIDACQKQEVPEVFSSPKSPQESANFQCASVSGSGPCQQLVNESTSMQVTYNIETVNQDNEEHNQNNEDKTTPGVSASSVPEAEQSEMEVGLIPVIETSVLPVPGEQLNGLLEGNEDQITSGILSSSVPEAVEIEQSEMVIGLIPAAETSVLPVPDEQPNSKLEGNEVDEHSCSLDKDFSIFVDSELLKRKASSMHKDDGMALSSEDNQPNDLPAPRSPKQSAYFQSDNDSGSVGICQSSRRRGIDELRAKLQSFRVSSTVKGSYIGMSAPRPKPGDSMSQSAIALLRNIENTTAVKAGHPVKPNADGKDSSRRALQPISGRPREH